MPRMEALKSLNTAALKLKEQDDIIWVLDNIEHILGNAGLSNLLKEGIN